MRAHGWFQKIDIRDLDSDDVYLRRWSLRLPFGTLKLHHILRPDHDRCHHDHPWWFFTLVLWGGYVERVGEADAEHRARPGRVYFRPALFRHRIASLPRGHAWTLVLTGRPRRRWGFHTNAGWVHWKVFCAATMAARVPWCKGDASPEAKS